MPSLGADMDHATLLEWLIAPGDTVTKGQVVAVVDTEKAAMDIESFEDGVVQELLVDVGTRVPVGAPLRRPVVDARTASDVRRRAGCAARALAESPLGRLGLRPIGGLACGPWLSGSAPRTRLGRRIGHGRDSCRPLSLGTSEF